MHRERAKRGAGGSVFPKGLKDLLILHKAERRGNAAFMVALLLAAGAFYYYRFHYRPGTADLEPMRAELEAWLAERDSAEAVPAVAPPEPFAFDPNTIGEEDWVRLGLSAKQAAAIERYKAKGGRFRTKADLGRMYTIRPEQFARLSPNIQLPDSLGAKPDRRTAERRAPRGSAATRAEWRTTERPAPQKRQVEVNTADSAALVELPGIGPAFARGIIRYRELLGGYHSLDQLGEVHVLKDKPDAVAMIQELLVVDTLAIRRIPLNTCTVDELAAHPYIRWKLAKPLIAYRQHHGPFRSLAGIKESHLIDEDLYRKLAPYLSVE